MKPVPNGVEGEIYLSGVGLAKGYHGNEALTLDRFMMMPWENGQKMYRTGDLAVVKDGQMVFRSRSDKQIQLRGYRIELEEINQALSKHPEVRMAISSIRKIEGDSCLLVHYTSESELMQEMLRNFLQKRLPSYMIPNHFIFLDKVPLTANGKLDVKALPDPTFKKSKHFSAPIGETETKLTQLWREILQVEENLLGRDANFFEMGGHSMRAIQLMNRILQKFGVELVLREVFESPTISEQARLIESRNAVVIAPIPSIGKKSYYLTSPAQKRMFYLQLLDPKSTFNNVSIALNLHDNQDFKKIENTFFKLLEIHEGLRTTFKMTSDGLFQSLEKSDFFKLQVIQDDPGLSTTDLFETFIRPFDLEHGPLIRIGLLQRTGGETILFLDIHHIICDGLSLNILVHDFNILYFGQEPKTPKVRYVDFSYWISQKMKEENQSRSYWQAQMAGEIPRLNLPVTMERSVLQSRTADRQSLLIDDEVYRKVKGFAQNNEVTEFVFLLSIYYLLLHKLCSNTDIIIGIDATGRSHAQLNEVVGTFVNILPIRMHISEEQSYIEFLRSVRTRVLEAYQHQELQIDELIHLAGEKNTLHRNPIFDVHFSMANAFDSQDQLKNLRFTPLELRRHRDTDYEFKIEAYSRDESLWIDFVYNEELYDGELMQLFVAYYREILQAVLENMTISIGQLEFGNYPNLA